MAIKNDLLDQLLSGRTPDEIFSKDGLLDELKKALSERILNAELDDHLETEAAEGGGNRRNGSSKKTVLSPFDPTFMGFVSWKDRKMVAKALRTVYRAQDADAGWQALDAFEDSDWGRKYPAIA